MKTKLTLFSLATALVASTLCAQVRQDYWDFDADDASDDLGAITNSGILKSAWNNSAAGGDAADGSGNWLVAGDSGTLSREAPGYGEYAVPVTTGRHRLEVDFASWNFDAASVGDSFVIRLDESVAAGGGNLARIELRLLDASTAQIRTSTDLTGGDAAFRTTNFNLVEAGGATVAIEFDFDADTVVYKVNGTVTHVFDTFDGADIANLRYQKNGVWTTAATSIVVDSFGWVTLEPDSTALEYFTFDSDLAGSRLQEIENSGSLANAWNINGAGSPSDAADGQGSWTIAGDSGTFTRRLPSAEYVAPVTTGRYRLEVDFASWNFDAASVGDNVNYRLIESAASGGSTIAQVQLRVLNASEVEVRLSGDFGSGSSFRNTSFSLVEAQGASAAIEFDFDNDTAYYIINGAITEVFTDFIGTDIGQFLYVKNGTWGTAASSASVDSFGYRSVEVPTNDPNAQEYWNFEGDALGSELDGITNSGVLNTPWNFSGAKGDNANGAGQWTVIGNSGTITRKVPDPEYAAPVSTGTYRLIVDFASWNVDAASDGDSFSYKLIESLANGGSTVAQVTFEMGASDVTIKWTAASTSGGSGSKSRTSTLPLVASEGARVELEFDFDNDTATFYLDGVFNFRIDDFDAVDIGQLLYSKSGTWGTAATTILIEEFGYVEVPANTIIDQWTFSEADGTAPSAALSNNGISVGGNPDPAVCQVSGGALLFGSDGVANGLFTTSDLSEDPITSGIVEMFFTVTSACFNNTFADSVLPARAGFRFQDRRDGNQNVATLRIAYDPVTNQYQAIAGSLDSYGVAVVQDNGSPVLTEEVTLRVLIDLDEPTVPGSFQAYFRVGDGEEQVVIFDGVVGIATAGSTQIDTFGILQQITNGSTNWQVGDTVTLDDLVIQRSGPVYRPVFLDISSDGSNATLSFDTVNTLPYSIKATGSLDTDFIEIDTLTGDGTRRDVIDTRGLLGNQFYIIEWVR